MELYKKYRPKTFDEIIGQEHIIKSLKSMVEKNKVPHTLLFTGASGCGKTTIARIIRKELKCGKYDFIEMNCADVRGIDEVRKIRQRIQQAPINGKCRVWLIDEAHKLTNDAQNAFLKMLEDTPKHIYFMLATTEPNKLLKTIQTRSTEISVKGLTNTSMIKLISDICIKEKVKISDDVIDKIIENSEGSARKALVLLNQIIDLDSEDEMLEAIKKSTMEEQAIQIARALHNPRTKWPEMAKILKDNETEEPEQIRWMILGYAKAVLLGNSNIRNRAFEIIQVFRDNFYDSKNAGLTACCYEIIEGNK